MSFEHHLHIQNEIMYVKLGNQLLLLEM